MSTIERYSSIEVALWRNFFSLLLTNIRYLETLTKALAILSKSAPCFEVIVIPDVRSQSRLIKLKYHKSGLFFHISIPSRHLPAQSQQ